MAKVNPTIHQLHVGKIDGIMVMQVGESKLTISNKSDVKKDVQQGKNEQIDLGKGAEKLSIQIIVADDNDYDALYNILAKKRKCTLTDRFLGTVKAGVDKFEVINSDTHLGITKINITFNINEDFKKFDNLKGAIAQINSGLASNAQPTFI